MNEHEHPLVGRAFHTTDERGRTRWQGTILADCGDGYFLATLFEWIGGTPTHELVIHMSEFAAKHPSGEPVFRIFEKMEWASSYMEVYARHRDAYLDKEREKEEIDQ